MRKKYTMTQEDFDEIMRLSVPAPLIMTHIIPPTNQQDQINKFWKGLGDKMGFVCSTVEMDGSQLNFTAIESK